jgi:UDP-D-galactose:(glucosyl)LPS alpha-1,6-D-galactosyltransferase
MANGLNDRGIVVTVAMWNAPAVEVEEMSDWQDIQVGPGEIVNPNMPRPARMVARYYRTMLWLRHLIKVEKFDLVLVTSPQCALAVRVALGSLILKKKVPCVSWVHSDLNNLGRNVFDRIPRLLRLCDGHLAITASLASSLKRLCQGVPVYLAPNPVFDKYPPIIRRPALGEASKFLFIGRLVREKRVDRVLKGLAMTGREGWVLSIIGDGTEKPDLVTLASNLGISDRVSWLGFCPNPWSRIDEASALLLTSEYEGSPLVAVESMARGVAVLAEDCPGGIADLVIDGRTGYTVRHGDIDAFSNLLARVIDGRLLLPPQDSIVAAVSQYSYGKVFTNYERKIRHLIGRAWQMESNF